MKYLIILMLGLASLSISGQETNTDFDGHKWQSPYHLPVPKDWTIERFLIPISFAPQISYHGIEDIRFTPGWGKVKSDQYWTYAFLWYLDTPLKTDAEIIAENLKAYYTGLFRSNTDSIQAATEKPKPVITSFKKLPAQIGDLETYTGSIEMVDYLQRKPLILHCIVHLKTCPEKNKTILFYELSPKPFTHYVWLELNQLWQDFKCNKDEAVK